MKMNFNELLRSGFARAGREKNVHRTHPTKKTNFQGTGLHAKEKENHIREVQAAPNLFNEASDKKEKEKGPHLN